MTEEKTNLPRMRTIREVAKLGILSENCLRQMQKQGKLVRSRFVAAQISVFGVAKGS